MRAPLQLSGTPAAAQHNLRVTSGPGAGPGLGCRPWEKLLGASPQNGPACLYKWGSVVENKAPLCPHSWLRQKGKLRVSWGNETRAEQVLRIDPEHQLGQPEATCSAGKMGCHPPTPGSATTASSQIGKRHSWTPPRLGHCCRRTGPTWCVHLPVTR